MPFKKKNLILDDLSKILSNLLDECTKKFQSIREEITKDKDIFKDFEKSKKLEKVNIPEKYKEKIEEDLSKWNVHLNNKYFKKIYLGDISEIYGNENTCALYDEFEDIIVIDSYPYQNMIYTLEHELFHRFTAKEILKEDKKIIISNRLLSIVSWHFKKIFKKDNNFDIKNSYFAELKFEELSANYISEKNYAERLKNKTYFWKLNEYDKKNIFFLEKISPTIFSLVELLEKKEHYQNKGINISPLDPINEDFLKKLEKSKDFPKIFTEFGEKYFPDFLK